MNPYAPEITRRVEIALRKARATDHEALWCEKGMNREVYQATVQGLKNYIATVDNLTNGHYIAMTNAFHVGMGVGEQWSRAVSSTGILLVSFMEEVGEVAQDPTPRPPTVGEILRDILRGGGRQ